MKIISLINEFTNTFNETFKENLNPLNLESKIRDISDTFTLRLYESFLITWMINLKILEKGKRIIILKKLK